MYGFIITTAGWKLLTSLLSGETLRITKVLVGSGKVTDEINPEELTSLVAPVAEATSTKPIVKDRTVSFIVEYRSDLNGGLDEGFWLNEYGIYALDNNDEEILLYYATLGDYPQYVGAYRSGSIDIRRYPISINLHSDNNVELIPPALAFMTAEDIEEYTFDRLLPKINKNLSSIITGHNTSNTTHMDIRNSMTALSGRIGRIEDAIFNNITANPFIVTFDNLEGVKLIKGIWNREKQRIEC